MNFSVNYLPKLSGMRYPKLTVLLCRFNKTGLEKINISKTIRGRGVNLNYY